MNKRLSGDETEDPEFPKIQFPSAKDCPKCQPRGSTFDSTEVVKFMKTRFSFDNLVLFDGEAFSESSKRIEDEEEEEIIPPSKHRYLLKRKIDLLFSYYLGPDFSKSTSSSLFKIFTFFKYSKYNFYTERTKMLEFEKSLKTFLRVGAGWIWFLVVCITVGLLWIWRKKRAKWALRRSFGSIVESFMSQKLWDINSRIF